MCCGSNQAGRISAQSHNIENVMKLSENHFGVEFI